MGASVADYQQRFKVISMHLFGGRNVLHVLQDELPEPGFEPVVPDLEDLYFATIKGFTSPTLASGTAN